MEQVRDNISPCKKILFSIIGIVAFLILIEGLVSIYYYRQNGGEVLASYEAIKSVSNKFRSDRNLFNYEPWAEYRNNNGTPGTSSTLVSYFSPVTGDTLDIYFFGGANLSGIDSHFVDLFKTNYAGRKSVRVHNYGSSYYYSYQNLMLMSSLTQNGHRPDIVVCLDGINEFQYGIVSYHRQSYFSHVFRQYFDKGLRSKGKFTFQDTAIALSGTPDFLTQNEFCNNLIDNYTTNLMNFRMLAGMIGAKAYFFCEPSPFYNAAEKYGSVDNAKDVSARFNYIYPKLQQMQDSIPGFSYIGNIAGQKEFIPGGLYTSSLNRKVAEKILAELKADFPLQ
jgi:hypothetical protein